MVDRRRILISWEDCCVRQGFDRKQQMSGSPELQLLKRPGVALAITPKIIGILVDI